MTTPKPTISAYTTNDGVEWVLRQLIASIREDGAVLEDEDGVLTTHPAVQYLAPLNNSLHPSRRLAGGAR